MIQQELNSFCTEWNNHRIRHYSLSEVPNGIPEILYHLPETAGEINQNIYVTTGISVCSGLGAEDCKKEVDIHLLQEAESLLTDDVELTSVEFSHYAEKTMHDYGVESPHDWNEALQLYFLLIEDINTCINQF